MITMGICIPHICSVLTQHYLSNLILWRAYDIIMNSFDINVYYYQY